MPITQAQRKANQKWDRNNLDRIQLVVRKGQREQIRSAALAAGESLNHYIVSAVRFRMEKDGKPMIDNKDTAAE